ncbi:MAG: DUF1467 family protein [Rhizomicrobium sp.]
MTTLAIHWAVLLSAFAIAWFLSLFCLFPVGLGEVDPETGAPRNPRILLKMALSTGIATVAWIAFYALIATGILQL